MVSQILASLSLRVDSSRWVASLSWTRAPRRFIHVVHKRAIFVVVVVVPQVAYLELCSNKNHGRANGDSN